MKIHLTNPRIRAGNLMVTALMCLITVMTLPAQDLINHLGYKPPLDERQQHYLRTITENPINENIQFVRINMDVLNGERFTFNPHPGLQYEVQKAERDNSRHSMTSWCGPIIGNESGDVNMVKAGEELVGHFTVEDMIYAITHIGEGLHVLYEVNSAEVPAEDCYNHDHDTKGPKEKRPVITNPDYVNNLSEEKLSGDCKIRVLVGFTSEAEDQYTNFLAQLNNLFNLANAAYNYGNVNFNIELAHAYRVDYTAVSDNSVNLSLWRGTVDGFMDEVHSLRGIWRADQCALIVPGGGGLAYLDLDYQNQFSVTGASNFNVFTFHHELGHNMLCTHDIVNTDQPGTIPYAGWGDPDGCFRTVMAYQAACGTGPCTRVNVFSRSVGTYFCGGSSRPIGSIFQRNVDRLELSRNAVLLHEIAPLNALYSGNYVFFENEAVNMAANSSFSYSGIGSNFFFMLSGSEGSFRAPNYVSIGKGFFAAEGSRFDAYIDNCDNPFGDTAGDAKAGSGEPAQLDEEKTLPTAEVKVFPNPFSQTVTIEFTTYTYDRVSIAMYDMMGQMVVQVLDNPNLAPGMHRFEINTTDLPSGVYSVALDADGSRTVKKVVKNR